MQSILHDVLLLSLHIPPFRSFAAFLRKPNRTGGPAPPQSPKKYADPSPPIHRRAPLLFYFNRAAQHLAEQGLQGAIN